MNSPLYKIGDVVQLTEHYKSSYLVGQPMIVLSTDFGEMYRVEYIYELLAGDLKIFLYERCVELV